MSIRHAFTSAKDDGGDATLVKPSDWNAGHTGYLTPTIVQIKHGGTTISSLTLDTAPVSGHTIILALDAFSSAQATAISSTNTTWAQMATFNDAGSAKLAIWAGHVSGTGGTVITITHSNSFMSACAIEIEDALTPTAGTSATGNTPTTAASTNFVKLAATTAGHLIAITGPVDNTGTLNRITASIPVAGLPYAIVPLILGYSQGYPIYMNSEANAGGLVAVEIT
jgi:hypothetical protein